VRRVGGWVCVCVCVCVCVGVCVCACVCCVCVCVCVCVRVCVIMQGTSFLNHFGLVQRTPNNMVTITNKDPAEEFKTVMNFLAFIPIATKGFLAHQIFQADETPTWCDMPSSKTLDYAGKLMLYDHACLLCVCV